MCLCPPGPSLGQTREGQGGAGVGTEAKQAPSTGTNTQPVPGSTPSPQAPSLFPGLFISCQGHECPSHQDLGWGKDRQRKTRAATGSSPPGQRCGRHPLPTPHPSLHLTAVSLALHTPLQERSQPPASSGSPGGWPTWHAAPFLKGRTSWEENPREAPTDPAGMTTAPPHSSRKAAPGSPVP